MTVNQYIGGATAALGIATAVLVTVTARDWDDALPRLIGALSAAAIGIAVCVLMR